MQYIKTLNEPIYSQSSVFSNMAESMDELSSHGKLNDTSREIDQDHERPNKAVNSAFFNSSKKIKNLPISSSRSKPSLNLKKKQRKSLKRELEIDLPYEGHSSDKNLNYFFGLREHNEMSQERESNKSLLYSHFRLEEKSERECSSNLNNY